MTYPTESRGGCGYVATGDQMIRSIEIKNFRCFESLTVENVARVNIIVGDNGSGKTALLEALFLALCSSPAGAVKVRQWRGHNIQIQGTASRIEEAIWGSLFHDFDIDRPISVTLTGTGPEARSFFLSRGGQRDLIPLDNGDSPQTGAITFDWKSHEGTIFSHTPEITPQGIGLDPVLEKLPDFHFYAANHPVSSTEVADLFTGLSKRFAEGDFLKVFTKEYSWIRGLSIESVGGFSMVHATVAGSPVKIPLSETSGAINRMVAILLSIAMRPKSVVLVDEIENGIYHTHHLPFWRALLDATKRIDGQLFLTTHNSEWLRALAEAAPKGMSDQIGFWRVRRDKKGKPCIDRLTINELREGLEFGLEMR